MTIPFVQAIPPIIGWFIGRWLDSVFDTAPYLMFILMAIGFIAGFREVYRIIKQFKNRV
ncbi:MAG: AtpZ/AtpI family protein [Parachlamydiaceae bacterium]|nr:AtpZ/AtpI family protein [Parachlamydiaceae bacterium]